MTEQFVDITDDEVRPAGRRWLAGTPGWALLLLTAVTIGLTLIAWAVPGGWWRAQLAAGAAWGVLGLLWAVRLGFGLVLARAEVRRRWPRWAVVPLAVAVTAALLATRTPIRIGVVLAGDDMRTFAQRPGSPQPQRVGPYRVAAAEHLPGGGARFLLRDSGFLDPSGFAFSPVGPPPMLGEDMYTPLGGGWYVWTQSW
ncbi:hypothetical protein QLQ12_39850 [Actinoplanes sp. NEAU-A12]|uniref:DUF1109 domain-containing protein n=1 Tax=Actinoplanes sandaracinus TaxID=3045177 RepID=A0ABT6WYE1_9ACTN|nr:hypothetical protein [Actinoplanes sandaracinus]MDI6104763.1 hypothetical protein [Actinoplanes sandaracinus]